MNNYAIIDETFDINITSTYHLSIQCSPFSLSFTILDTIRMKYIALKHYQFDNALEPTALREKLKSIFHTDGYLVRGYKSLHFNYITPKAVLVPSPVFQPEMAPAYFRYTSKLDDQEEILFNRIPKLDSYLLFTMPSALKAEILRSLDDVRFFHQINPVIEEAMIEVKAKPDQPQIHVQIHPEFIDIAVFTKGRLELYNSFNYKNPEDIAFYVLYLFDQFEFSQEATKVILSGQIEKEGNRVGLLNRYIRNTSYQQFNKSFSYSYTFNELPQHQFAHLINLSRCEL